MLSLVLRRSSLIFHRHQIAPSSSFSHITSDGNLTMVDIGKKVATQRHAVAEAVVKFPDAQTYQSYFNVTTKKGDARLCSKIAGILAAKVRRHVLFLEQRFWFLYSVQQIWYHCVINFHFHILILIMNIDMKRMKFLCDVVVQRNIKLGWKWKRWSVSRSLLWLSMTCE